MKNSVKLAVIGLGNRGNVYGDYLLKFPEKGQVIYAYDPDAGRFEKFALKHGIDQTKGFADADKMLDEMKGVDAVIISNLDAQHFKYTLKAIEKGYHVLLEKPMSPRPFECVAMGEFSKIYGKILMVAHVLRYTPFFSTLKELLDGGAIGRLMSIQHNENVSYFHMAHSYVRGNFRNSDLESPMILAKCCHDMDILLWLVGYDCKKVSSFGKLSYFR
ncbi:MAG: Gfo/Idh/MocA family oxidoreductase, partial [Clostridiales bacterium]|nr:Gfo/Idh/MocA family oxidoreductase [Clostridiales bacterium]